MAAAACESEQAPGGPGMIQEPQLQVIGHVHSDASDAWEIFGYTISERNQNCYRKARTFCRIRCKTSEMHIHGDFISLLIISRSFLIVNTLFTNDKAELIFKRYVHWDEQRFHVQFVNYDLNIFVM